MADSEIKFVGEMSVLRVEPGDVIVVHCDETLTPTQQAGIRVALERTFGGNAKSVILPRGMRLGVMRDSEAE